VSSRLVPDGNVARSSILIVTNLSQKLTIVFNFTTDRSKLGLTEFVTATVHSISGPVQTCNGHQARIASSVLKRATMKLILTHQC